MGKDIHDKPFDSGTKIKLEIFKEYLESWLPTFIYGKDIYWKDIYIFDFFAGEGRDSVGNNGSALLIIDEIKRYHTVIKERNLNIHIIFNDLDSEKIKCLEKLINEIEPDPPYSIDFENKDFTILFYEIYSEFLNSNESPILFFIDQYGIKNVTEDLFLKITELKRTDFIFFISSSFVRRFSESEEFRKYLDISKSTFAESKPFHSHKIVFEYYKNLIPENKDYFLAPFSIQKNANIYGLIFGSSHSFGIEKFLNICWKINPITGNANYNIDEESLVSGQLSIFPKENIPLKLQLFEQELRANILNQKIVTNKEMYFFTFNYGCLPNHANNIIKNIIEEGKIKPFKTSASKIHKLDEDKIEVINEKI